MTQFEKRRYLGPLVLVLATTAAIFTALIAFRGSYSIQMGYLGKLQSITTSLANSLGRELSEIPNERLQSRASYILNDPGVIQLILFDAQGTELIRISKESDGERGNARIPTVTPILIPPGEVVKVDSNYAIMAKTVFYDDGRPMGGAIVTIDRAHEKHLIRMALTSTIALGLLVFLLSMIPVYLLVLRINRNAENLEQLNLELELASKIKERFLANMSHEIRTPMNSIIGFTELLEDSGLNPEQQEWVSVIQHNGKQLIHLINQILSFSRIENEKVKIEVREVQIHKVLAQVFNSFKHQCEQKQLEFRLDVDAGMPEIIHLDPDALVQCLNNLISNAVKFTETGSIAIGASVQMSEGEDMPNDRFVVTVSDTGRGIPESKQQEIFNAFSQVKAEDSYVFNGTGLGLSITKSIVALMDGTVSVQSTMGAGSVFTISIPIELRGEAQQELPLPSPALDPIVRHEFSLQEKESLAKMRVIVAEDNAFNQKLILKMLSRFGVQSDLVPDGKALLKSVSLKSYDLILMDINMPDMNGWEASQRIRQLNPMPRPRIVAVSASSNEEFVKHCFEAGMDDFMGKPFRQEELKRIMLACIAMQNASV